MTEPKMKCADCGCEVNRNVIQGMYYCPRCDDDKSERDVLEITNRDVINAMTDEELAAWKCKFPDRHDRNGHCRIYWLNPQRCRPELNCRQCLTEWLKADAGKHQEVAE